MYGAFLSIDWNLFDGFARENTLREAEARRDMAAADLAASELRAVREVWKAYSDVKTASPSTSSRWRSSPRRRRAYAATLESYQRAGLATVLDMLAAQRDLASARSIAVASRAELLTAVRRISRSPPGTECSGRGLDGPLRLPHDVAPASRRAAQRRWPLRQSLGGQACLASSSAQRA